MAVLEGSLPGRLDGQGPLERRFFYGILHMELLSDDNVDLSVSGVELTKGEGPEGKRESNRCTYFSHVRPCTLPAIGELPCRIFRNSLEKIPTISGSKT